MALKYHEVPVNTQYNTGIKQSNNQTIQGERLPYVTLQLRQVTGNNQKRIEASYAKGGRHVNPVVGLTGPLLTETTYLQPCDVAVCMVRDIAHGPKQEGCGSPRIFE